MASSTLTAHAAFFVDGATSPEYGSLLTREPLLALAGGLFTGLATWIFVSTCADPRRDRCLLRWLSELVSGVLLTLTEFVPPIARIALGVTLAWCAALGSIATPNLHVGGPTGTMLRATAIVLGVMLVLGVRARTCAAAAGIVFLVGAVASGTPIVVLERLDIVGLACFVVLIGGRRLEPRLDAVTLRSIARASNWLRVLVALGLFTVAITEKLANVPMTARVLAEHPHVDLGLLLGTDPRTTVLLLGAAEVAFAVLVLMLPLPELVALAIGAPFVASVGEFGLLEVPGHLPVWGAVAALALLGAHPQTADALSIRPPWLRGRTRTPEAARVRLVGDRHPWAAEPGQVAAVAATVAASRRITVGGWNTSPAPVPTRPTGPAPIPPAPLLAPQVAAWLAAPAEDPIRFQWADAPGTGIAAS